MFQFILITLVFCALGMLLYLMTRALPRIEEGNTHEAMRHTWLDRWVMSEFPERIDVVLNAFFAKFLRKTKIVLLKIDNTVTTLLHRMRQQNGNGNGDTQVFKELSKNNDTPSLKE